MRIIFRSFFISFLMASVALPLNVFGQSIWSNSITGTSPNVASPYLDGNSVASNITVSGIGRGSGITGVNANDRYNAQNWTNTSSIDLNDYFYFTISPDASADIDFTSFVYTGQATSTGPVSFAIRSSIDNYTANIGTPTATGTTISLSAATFQNLTSPITFRIYGWGGSSGTGTFSINDFTFNGAISAPANSVNLSLAPSVAAEAAGTVIIITANASTPVTGNKTVALSITGTGVTAVDYTLSNTTITIPSGQTSGSVTFTTLNDAIPEGDETAVLTLSSPSAGLVLGSTFVKNLVILDNTSGANNSAWIFSGNDADSSSKATTNAKIGIGLTSIPAGIRFGVSGHAMFGNNVSIGTSCIPADAKLAVNGKIYATEVQVKLTNALGCFPDYVFSSNYALPSLLEVEKYIKMHNHLPEIPSAADVEAKGINLGEMDVLLLKKIEELTLYVIELKKENEEIMKRLGIK